VHIAKKFSSYLPLAMNHILWLGRSVTLLRALPPGRVLELILLRTERTMWRTSFFFVEGITRWSMISLQSSGRLFCDE
jgi:hypothetical protein